MTMRIRRVQVEGCEARPVSCTPATDHSLGELESSMTTIALDRARMPRRWRSLMAATFVVALLASVAAPGSATSLSISPNATVASGETRIVAAAWGSNAPFDVNFQCNGFPTCANFVASATTVTGLARTGSLTTCTQESRTVSISVTETGSNPIHGSSRTTWQAGSFCQP